MLGNNGFFSDTFIVREHRFHPNDPDYSKMNIVLCEYTLSNKCVVKLIIKRF